MKPTDQYRRADLAPGSAPRLPARMNRPPQTVVAQALARTATRHARAPRAGATALAAAACRHGAHRLALAGRTARRRAQAPTPVIVTGLPGKPVSETVEALGTLRANEKSTSPRPSPNWSRR